jgi:cytochrome c oxidase cbb3-type subunit 4
MITADFFINASSVMTAVSFITFVGILWWAFSKRRDGDFSQASMLPFADDGKEETELHNSEKRHV